MGCKECSGKGYTEYKTGVVSPHIPYKEELAKEPCECTLKEPKFSASHRTDWNGIIKN